MSLSRNNENPDKSYIIFIGVRMWSRTPAENLDPISARCFDNGDDGWEKVSTATPGVGSFGRQTSTSSIINRALSSSNFRGFNKKVKERTFKKGELILAVRRPMVMTHKTKEKFQPKWEGPFVVESVYSNRAYRQINLEGNILMMPINGKFLKKYYPWSY